MQVRMESHEGPLVGTPVESISLFREQTHSKCATWGQQLRDDPDNFHQIERDIDRHYRLGAGRLIASLLRKVTAAPERDEHVHRVQQQSVAPLKAPEPRPLQVRLLCGLMLFVTTWYCAPAARKKKECEEEQAGLYPELAALGFGKGCSPALQYKVARIVALSPSIEVARKELAREGVVLDKKAVRRIAEQLGLQLLELRRREVFLWRAGNLPAGSEFAGRRVVVQIDGGRVRLRENKKQKGKQKGKNAKHQKQRQPSRKKGVRQKFETPWREPKVLIIFEIDEQGKMIKKHCQPLIDGTLQGPDHLAELVAFHLHRLGVARAELLVFASDGARWIWDRLEWIQRQVGIDPSRVVGVLDFCHAAHHISLALESLGLDDKARRQTYGQLRKLLKQSGWQRVVEELKGMSAGQPTDHAVWTELRYLENHGEQGHLQYVTFRRRGIPCGSGAIESTIRRVINLRLKSNATFWREENAEAIFLVRATLLCDRWDETLKRVRSTMARDRRIRWHWKPLLTTNSNADVAVQLQLPQPQVTQQSTTIAG